MSRSLLCLGYGYSARAIAAEAMRKGWQVTGTTRSADKAAAMADADVAALDFSGEAPSPDVSAAIKSANAVVVSIAPDAAGDPVLRHHAADFAAVRWVAYLSTVGVYGDHGGAWVDEATPPRPVSTRSVWRVAAEDEWRRAAAASGFACDILRLSGIYGPGRNAFAKLRDGTARALVKPGQVFNRIHVADIAGATLAALGNPGPAGETRLFNVTDDEPSPPQEALWYAADIAGLPRPPAIDFETAELTPMARSFYGECKRVSNGKVKRELGYRFRYPTWRDGLDALRASGEADT